MSDKEGYIWDKHNSWIEYMTQKKEKYRKSNKSVWNKIGDKLKIENKSSK